jgi:hypothetical protein
MIIGNDFIKNMETYQYPTNIEQLLIKLKMEEVKQIPEFHKLSYALSTVTSYSLKYIPDSELCYIVCPGYRRMMSFTKSHYFGIRATVNIAVFNQDRLWIDLSIKVDKHSQEYFDERTFKTFKDTKKFLKYIGDNPEKFK